MQIAQRLKRLNPSYKALRLALEETSEDDYYDALHSTDPAKLKNVAYPLERAFEVLNNLVIELTALGLKEAGQLPIDAPRDLAALVAEGAITQRLCDELTDIHRVRNDLQHQYPDVRAKHIFESAEQLVKSAPVFGKAYSEWLGRLGYGSRN